MLQEKKAATSATRELRLGLVCYGGVSLAIYMHGITKEIHKLVRASRAFEDSNQVNPFDQSTTEHAYWTVLKRLEDHSQLRTRVVVDVVSGTSAGGINGVYLAKALANDLSQAPLRNLWMNNGDISRLLRGPRWIPMRARAAWFATKALNRLGKVKPPLRGNEMCRWLYEALRDMDATRSNPDASLMPEGHSLELFVTMTDFYGRPRYIPIRGNLISDRQHRHVLSFRRDTQRGINQFGSQHNRFLAFSARATSCFPGAFPPINLELFDSDAGSSPTDGTDLTSEFFRIYELSDQNPTTTYFIDGGVLDNAPFGHTIAAIIRKPATTEVVRRLVYIEPHPRSSSTSQMETPPAAPSWLKTIWGGKSSIPAREPIIDDLERVRQFNRRVTAVNNVILDHFANVAASTHHILPDVPGEVTAEQIRGWSDRFHEEAKTFVGASYETYERLKVMSVVDAIAMMINGVCNFPEDSNEAEFVLRTLRIWAKDRGMFSSAPDAAGLRGSLLRTFDLPYGERRLRFVIQGVNEMYRSADRFQRGVLNEAKKVLYELRAQITTALAGTDAPQEIGAEVIRCFDPAAIRDFVRSETGPKDFLDKKGSKSKLQSLYGSLESWLQGRLKNISQTIFDAFISASASLSPAQKHELLVRYLGFPMWDALIFPLRALGDVGELDTVTVVRFSPDDATRLVQGGAETKLEGVGIHHFRAFFKRSYRENDYVWGRLDGVESLISLLTEDFDERHLDGAPLPYRSAFEAVFAEEEDLEESKRIRSRFRDALEALPSDGQASARATQQGS